MDLAVDPWSVKCGIDLGDLVAQVSCKLVQASRLIEWMA